MVWHAFGMRVVVSSFVAVFVVACGQPNLPLPDEPTALDRFVIGELEAEAVPGLQAVVVRRGAIEFSGAWGLADTDTGRLVTTDTLFTLASVSKLVVGVAVMQLVEDGRIELDDAVDSHVAFPVRHPRYPETPITVRMLLNHTGGIADNWDVMDPLYTEGDSPLALGTFMAGYFESSGAYYDARKGFTESPPGRGYEYTNIGNALAAHLVEAVDGRDFEACCQAEIFAPLGMQRTSFRLSALDTADLAMPTRWSRGWSPVGHLGWPDYPNGSLRTSATQFAQFLLATTGQGPLGGAAVLQPATIAEMLRIQDPEIDSGQGLVYFWWQLDGQEVVGHDGGERGIATEVFVRPALEDGVLLFANGELSASSMARIERRLLAL